MECSSFQYKKLLEIKKLSLLELSAYYRKLRSYEYDANKPLDSSLIKKRLFFLTKLILRIDRLLTGRELILFDDKRTGKYLCGKVYASSHVGRYDIESAMEAINEQAYFVMGDPEETYRNLEGFFLDKLSGRISMDTGYVIHDIFKKHREGHTLTSGELALYNEYKKDRHICEVTCTKRVANNENVLLYPEAAWNLTHRFTQTLYDGTARIAINGDGVIVPIGMVRKKKTYIVNIGEEIDISGAQNADASDVTKILRERLNSLVGAIVFDDDKKVVSRDSLGDYRSVERAFIDDIMSEAANGYNEDIIEKTRFYDPNYPENVFETTYQKRL